MLFGVQRRQVFEQDLVLRRFRRLAIDPVNLDQRKVAFTVLRCADLALDGVAGVQVEAANLARAYVNVIGAGQIRGVRRAQEAEAVRQGLQRAVTEDCFAFFGLVLQQGEDQFVFAQPVGAFDVVCDGHVQQLADMKGFEFG